MRVGFIGTGKIAAALVRGLAGQGHDLWVSDRNAQVASNLAADHAEVRVADNATVVANTDVVFLCLMAEVAHAILPGLGFRADQAVVSVMVDVPMADLHGLCAPARDIALTIPLSAVATGGSMLPVYPGSAALEALFGATDTVFAVPSEAALNAHFAGCALSAPLIALMQEGAGWLGRQTGDPAAAEAYVAGIFAGFLRQMSAQGDDFEALLKTLSTEGGLNASLRSHMAAQGAPEALIAGLDALKLRLGL